MWIDDVECKALRTMARHSTSMYIVSKPDGTIIWANTAFLEWSKYTLFELIKLTWSDISVKDDNLKADISATAMLDEYNVQYTVQKSYLPKNDKPHLGMLHVTRYPATGDIEFCWCRWEPLYNGTAKAFEHSLKSQNEFTSILTRLTNQMETMNAKSVEETALSSIIKLASKYPKASWGIFMALVITFAGSNVTTILQKLGYFGPEVVKLAPPTQPQQ